MFAFKHSLFYVLVLAGFLPLSCFCDCIKVSKADCEALKAQLQDSLGTVQANYNSCLENLENLQYIRSYYEYAYVDFTNFLDFNNLWDLSATDYSPSAETVYYQLNDVNDNLGYFLDLLGEDLVGIDLQLPDLAQQVLGLNCEPCSEGSDPGSGGGDSGGGGGCGDGDDDDDDDSGGCPCAAAIESLRIILGHIDGDLHEIKERLSYWERYILMIEKIRDKTESLDDFMHDDLQAFLVQFSTSFYDEPDFHNDHTDYSYYKLYTELMARSWFYYDYTNATVFVSPSGGEYDFIKRGKLMFSILDQEGGADLFLDQYRKYNWFQRVEFLLGNLTGLFNTTNIVAELSDTQNQQAEDQQQAVNDAFGEGAFSDAQSLVGRIFQSIESVQGKLNPFHDLFSSSYSSGPIEILPEASVSSLIVQQTSPGFSLDTSDYGSSGFGIHSIVDIAHNLTTFLYLVLFLVIDIFAFVFFVRGLMSIVQWYHKIVLSWVKTFNAR